jgi:hypothetical protein
MFGGNNLSLDFGGFEDIEGLVEVNRRHLRQQGEGHAISGDLLPNFLCTMKAMEAKSGLSIHTLLAYPPYEQGWRGEYCVDVAYMSFESGE